MSKQKGSVLLVSLIMLLVLTVIGIASVGGISSVEKMAQSHKDYDAAFEMAEAALVEGERWLDAYDGSWKQAHVQTSCTGSYCWKSTCDNGLCFKGSYPIGASTLCEVDSSGAPVWESKSTWTTKAKTYSVSVPAMEAPRYLIEFLCFAPRDPKSYTVPPDYTSWVRIYRITAMGYGVSPDTRVMLQSTYRVD